MDVTVIPCHSLAGWCSPHAMLYINPLSLGKGSILQKFDVLYIRDNGRNN